MLTLLFKLFQWQHHVIRVLLPPKKKATENNLLSSQLSQCGGLKLENKVLIFGFDGSQTLNFQMNNWSEK